MLIHGPSAGREDADPGVRGSTRIMLALCVLTVVAACVAPYGIYHTVKQGQTLYGISRAYGVEEDRIVRVNRLKDRVALRVGQKLFIPGAMKEIDVEPAAYSADRRGGATPGDGGQPVPGQAPGEDKGRPASPGTGASFVWPVKGRILSGFGTRGARVHDGLDIAASAGDPIRAAAAGKVIYSDNGLRGYGNIIVIRHQGSMSTIYAHNRVNLVKEGEFVEQGQVIGKVGDSGNASGPHLHFEVRMGEIPVNPLRYLPSD